MNKEDKNDIPYGYERITYSRCGDQEMLEIFHPASDDTGKVSITLSPDIRVSLDPTGEMSVSEIADKLKDILKEQMDSQ